jgi:hypothetical protein
MHGWMTRRQEGSVSTMLILRRLQPAVAVQPFYR